MIHCMSSTAPCVGSEFRRPGVCVLYMKRTVARLLYHIPPRGGVYLKYTNLSACGPTGRAGPLAELLEQLERPFHKGIILDIISRFLYSDMTQSDTVALPGCPIGTKRSEGQGTVRNFSSNGLENFGYRAILFCTLRVGCETKGSKGILRKRNAKERCYAFKLCFGVTISFTQR